MYETKGAKEHKGKGQKRTAKIFVFVHKPTMLSFYKPTKIEEDLSSFGNQQFLLSLGELPTLPRLRRAGRATVQRPVGICGRFL